MKFDKVNPEIFKEIQINAGVILKEFDPAEPTLTTENIVCATTGGITVNCTPTFVDYGSDIDNVPDNTMELKRIDGYTCEMSFTVLNMTEETVKMALGATETLDDGRIICKPTLDSTDFKDFWYVGDLSDGGCIAVLLKNALSTAGFSLKTTKKGKGTVGVTLTGHVSITDPDVIPMEFYIITGDAVEGASTTTTTTTTTPEDDEEETGY